MKTIHDYLPEQVIIEYRIDEERTKLTIGLIDRMDMKAEFIDCVEHSTEGRSPLAQFVSDKANEYFQSLFDMGVIEREEIEEEMTEEREMTLEEWCCKLPSIHRVRKELSELLRRKVQLEDLLCIIHRDGGQYIGEHGLEKAVRDARSIVAAAIHTVDLMGEELIDEETRSGE
jgi:hypothetical protein